MNAGWSSRGSMQDVQPRPVDAPAAETPAPQVVARLARPPGWAAPAEHPGGDIAALQVAAEELRVVEEELRVQQVQIG